MPKPKAKPAVKIESLRQSRKRKSEAAKDDAQDEAKRVRVDRAGTPVHSSSPPSFDTPSKPFVIKLSGPLPKLPKDAYVNDSARELFGEVTVQ